MEPETTYAAVFGNEPDIPFKEKVRVINEVSKLGGLTFTIEKNAEGWNAECVEVPAIITGNTNPNPSNLEIESLIREAIFSAFNIRFDAADQSVPSPLNFVMNFA